MSENITHPIIEQRPIVSDVTSIHILQFVLAP